MPGVVRSKGPCCSTHLVARPPGHSRYQGIVWKQNLRQSFGCNVVVRTDVSEREGMRQGWQRQTPNCRPGRGLAEPSDDPAGAPGWGRIAVRPSRGPAAPCSPPAVDCPGKGGLRVCSQGSRAMGAVCWPYCGPLGSTCSVEGLSSACPPDTPSLLGPGCESGPAGQMPRQGLWKAGEAESLPALLSALGAANPMRKQEVSSVSDPAASR